MNGGDTDTGGTQVNPGVNPPSNPNSQPVGSAAPAAEDASVLTISHDQPSTSSPSQPASQSLPTPQPTPIPTPAPAPSPASSVPPVPPVNTPTPQSLPVSPLHTPTTLNSPIPTQPQVTPQPLQPATPLSPAPFSSQQPLSPSPFPPQQPITQNNTPAEYSTDNGDIILNTPKKKNKKPLIIIGGIMFLCICIGSIIALLLQNQASLNTDGPTGIQAALNQFANYFFYGEENTDTKWEGFNKSIEKPIFYQKADYINSEHEYFETLENYFNKLTTNIEAEQGSNEYISNLLSDYNNMLDLNINYYTSGIPTRSSLLSKYVEGGENETKQYINERTKPYENIKKLYDLDFYDLITSWSNGNLALTIIYDNNGCIIDGRVDSACAENIVDETKENYSIETSEAFKYMEEELKLSQDDMINDLFKIRKYIKE